MNILFHLHKYVPEHGAGAEWYAHYLAKHLQSQGHQIRICCPYCRPIRYDDINVERSGNSRQFYKWCDIAITHLDLTQTAIQRTTNAGIPLVHLIHNDAQLEFHKVRQRDAALVVYNSQWIASRVNWPGRSLICRPHTPVDYYRVREVGYLPTPLSPDPFTVTLLNLTEAKGAPTFYHLAAQFPDLHFLGVTGAYGVQIKPPSLPNLEIIPNQRDVREVYKRTSVLLMPSSYESWGRSALEAAASGIPVICGPTPGLRESLGKSGIFIDPSRVDLYAKELRKLQRADYYLHHSRRVYTRAREVEELTTQDLANFTQEIEKIYANK